MVATQNEIGDGDKVVEESSDATLLGKTKSRCFCFLYACKKQDYFDEIIRRIIIYTRHSESVETTRYYSATISTTN